MKKDYDILWSTAVFNVGTLHNTVDNFYNICQEFINLDGGQSTREELLEYMDENFKATCEWMTGGGFTR